ncbi:MAG: PAS domain-containing sensor histidine kinase, partial [Mangrovibacterium sp.]
NGKGELFIGVILNDISERKKATQALRESEQNYRALIDGMNETVWVIGTDGQLIDVNKRAITATGYSKEELLKMGLQGLDASLSREEITKLVKHMPKDQFQIFETVHRTKKGRSYPVEVYSSLVTYQGQKAILSIARDISSRKQMEAQRRYDEDSRHVLYELAQTAISAKSLEEMAVIFRIKLSKLFDTRNFLLALYHPGTDSLGKVLLISEKSQEEAWQFEKIFAKQVIYRRGSLLLDKASFLQLVSAQKLQLPRSLPENWLGVALMDGQQAIGLIRVQSFTNPLAYNRSSVRLLELAAQQLTMVVLRNRMILDLIAAKEKAEESERLRAAFLANMSHEIRTPMNGILGFLSLLETPDLEEENKKEYINIVNKSGQRLLETINDIIEISKIEAGESRLNSMVVNIREILQYQLDFFQPQAEEKGLHLFIKKQLKQDEALVQTDKHKLEGILTNLIKNALKFTEEGYVELGNYREGNRLVFYVKDTGKGIPPERIGTIFERFVQADQELTRAYEGSGLGLAIAKAYLDTLGGEISVQSTPGQGSCFTFYIPWLPAQQTGPRKQ